MINDAFKSFSFLFLSVLITLCVTISVLVDLLTQIIHQMELLRCISSRFKITRQILTLLVFIFVGIIVLS